jgi:UDP:flavonoid glycosyltransferase YjiC (YdhE family)
LNLVPVSPAVYEPNPHWEPHHRVVGYWFAQDPAGWQPSDELLAFLQAGEPPVAVSLGAMSMGDGGISETASLFMDAIQEAGVRAVIQGWDSALEQLTLPPIVHAAGSMPHSWLLRRCAALVHHGGFGTTSAGMRAGIPALVIPHIADQFFWAQRVHELGVGPQPIRRPKLSTSTLAASLHELVSSRDLRTAASTLGGQIRCETGVGNAVRQIEKEFTGTQSAVFPQ